MDNKYDSRLIRELISPNYYLRYLNFLSELEESVKMVHYLRKLKVKFVGDAEYLPKDMVEGKFVPVLGYSTKNIIINKGTDEQTSKEEVLFHCIGISGKIVHIAAFNCAVMIDEKAEIEALTIASEICGKLSMAISNCNSLLKYLSSKVEKEGGGDADANQG